MILGSVALRERQNRPIPLVRNPHPYAIQPNSIELRLGDKLLLYPEVLSSGDSTTNSSRNFPVYDSRQPLSERPKPLVYDLSTLPDKPYIIYPGEFILAASREFIDIPMDLVGILDGKSSWARIGLLVHCTAGYIDSGWEGPITFEIANLGPMAIALYLDDVIAQMRFHMAVGFDPDTLYGSPEYQSHYVGSGGPVASLIGYERDLYDGELDDFGRPRPDYVPPPPLFIPEDVTGEVMNSTVRPNILEMYKRKDSDPKESKSEDDPDDGLPFD